MHLMTHTFAFYVFSSLSKILRIIDLLVSVFIWNKLSDFFFSLKGIQVHLVFREIYIYGLYNHVL